MRAGKRRQTETKQTRSCNVVLKKLSDKFIPPIRSTLRSSKLTADITETQKKIQQKPKSVALKQKTPEQPGKITAKTTLKPASAKQSTTQGIAVRTTATALRKNSDNVVTRRSTIVDIPDDGKSTFAIPKVGSLSIRLSKFRRNSVASDIVTKKTTEANFRQAKLKDSASTSKAALTAALKSAVRNANVGSNRTSVRLEAEPKSDTRTNLKIETKPSSKATEFRNKSYGKIIAKSDEKYAATVTTANASNSQSANPTSKTKMFKQTKLVSIASNPQTPPTIAASRSRRSIKPNPKYASEDIVTPKYVTALASDSPQSRRSYARGNEDRFADSGDDFFSREADDFIDDDNDDDIADEAFDPRTQNSDEDLSDLEIYGNDNVVYPRRRGRPGKASQAATSGRATKSAASTGHQRSSAKTAPSQLQQLRRTMALSVPRVSVTPGANKRKIVDDNAGNSEVPRKRMVISSGVSVAKPSIVSSSTDSKRVIVRRSVPLVNGANKSSVSVTPTTVGTKIIGGNRASITAQNSASAKLTRSTTMYQVSAKTEKSTATMSRINATSTKTIKPTMAKQPSKDPAEGQNLNIVDDTHTFTIVNIDDIINQDDVLISKTSGQLIARKQGSAKSTPGDASNAARANSSGISDGSTQAKRQPFKTRTPPTATKQIVALPQVNKTVINSKPAPRILNSEVGKRTQPMKPLMNMVDDMAKDLRPVIGSGVAEGEFELDDDDILDDEIASTPPIRSQMPPRRTIFRNTVTPSSLRAAETKKSSGINATTLADQKRRLASLLCDDEENTATFKKPEAKENSLAATNQRATHTLSKQQKVSLAASGGGDIVTTVTKTQQQHIQLPPETTTVRCEGGRVIRKITCYETWYVISVPKELPHVTRSFLEIPLVKLANVVNRIKMPTNRWSSKVTLYKLSPASMAKQSVVIYTGDLKSYNIPEMERHKYQPSCVLFRRAVTDRNQVRLPYDRAIIFKNKSFYTNIEGKHVNLVGAPETISNAKEVETLLEIIDSLTLKSSLVDLITLK